MKRDAMADDCEEVLPLLSVVQSADADDLELARLALEDFFALIGSGLFRSDSAGRMPQGVMEITAWLASTASAPDLDDVDWSGPFHPGSVVWPAVIATAMSCESSGNRILQAGVSGYRVAKAAAVVLGTEHAGKWHLTATAGTLGAAVGSAVVRDTSPEVTARCLSLATLSLGGLGQAPLERRGAARFTRAAAAVQGVLSATMATNGVPAAVQPWSGAKGVQNVLKAGNMEVPPRVDPWSDLGFRYYPVNGFVQAAVHTTAELASTVGEPIDELVWELPEGVLPLLSSPDHGDWWNARLAAARSLAATAPWSIGDSGPLDAHVDQVQLVAADVALGAARVRARTVSGDLRCEAPRRLIRDDLADATLLHAKWVNVLGVDAEAVSGLVDDLLDGNHETRTVIEALSR